MVRIPDRSFEINGGTVVAYRSYVFVVHDCGKLNGLMCLHVDDIYWAGDKSFDKEVVQALRDKWSGAGLCHDVGTSRRCLICTRQTLC